MSKLKVFKVGALLAAGFSGFAKGKESFSDAARQIVANPLGVDTADLYAAMRAEYESRLAKAGVSADDKKESGLIWLGTRNTLVVPMRTACEAKKIKPLTIKMDDKEKVCTIEAAKVRAAGAGAKGKGGKAGKGAASAAPLAEAAATGGEAAKLTFTQLEAIVSGWLRAQPVKACEESAKSLIQTCQRALASVQTAAEALEVKPDAGNVTPIDKKAKAAAAKAKATKAAAKAASKKAA